VQARQTPIALRDLAAPLEAQARCEQLGLQPSAVALPVELSPTAPRRLLRGDEIPLALIAAGVAVASLRPDPSSAPEVSVLRREAGWARIAWSVGEGTLIGWVPERALVPLPVRGSAQGLHGIGIGGGGSAEGIARKERVTRVCSDAVELSASVAGTSKVVGRVQPRGVMRVQKRDGDEAHVEIDGSAIELAPGATLTVSWSRIERCPEERKEPQP